MTTGTGFVLPQVTESEEFPLVPEGLYLFKLTNMENVGPGMAFDDRPAQDRIRWVFLIENVISGDDESEDFVGKEFWAWTSFNMNVKSNMYKWTVALLGRDVDKDEKISAADLIGKRARANVEHYQKKSGDTGHRIASLLKAPTRKKSAPPPPIDEDEDDDEEVLF